MPKAPDAGISEPIRLNHGELVAFLLAERDLYVAQIAVERDKAMGTLAQIEATQRCERAQRGVQDAVAALDQARQKHRRLANELAARYNFDWQQSSIVPETGEILSTPPTR